MFLWFSLSDHKKMIRFFYCCLWVYLPAWIMKFSFIFAEARQIDPPFIYNYPDSGLLAISLKFRTLIIAGLVLLIIVLMERFLVSKRDKSSYLLIRKWLFIILAIAVVVSIVLVAIANAGYTAESRILERLIISDSFGSNRGYIWRKAVELFADFPVKQKLIGSGPGTFYYAADAAFGAEMRALYGDPFIDAHCEFLQFLVTTGIIGALGYFGAQISVIRVSVKNSVIRPESIILGVMIASFLFQGIVNNPTVFATPQMFAVLGLAISKNG